MKRLECVKKFNFVLISTITDMTIKNENDYDQALTEIKSWLTKKDYNRNSLEEIEDVINAVENYMGMPLPAKHFILHNCLSPN